ncbi:TetR family transcriptional regulator C-terminal domain-containing protein [Leucobacter rhizosphaerae]|uniref:TetR family transcriptional regulator C-terminal domain-containing protein n=1 Tax=Leucobacter rhizosphaerae TaxID=2932245 RepID=A0ABY4FU68_9MICO|nr:TetR/AcrR family transcriptional regulator [Leucobacter rhizosphaerae]UOQ59820.1 TetR family transcriptional regulator C-terminal domain-containing protein [Leucobacter rhizosphaerae]
MPKIVDHDLRREEVSDAVLQLIAREGIGAVTLRAVARESGWSTGVIGHYFANRHAMLIAALRRAAYLQATQFKMTRQEGGTALEQLRRALISVLPLDERRVALTRIFLFFYAEGAQDEASRDEIAEYLENWRRIVERILSRAVEQGELSEDIDTVAKAAQLVACADAISSHAILDPQILKLVQDRPDIAFDGLLNTAIIPQL